MSSPTIRVKYDQQTGTWTITPMVQPMLNSGAIVFQQDPPHQPWKFVRINIENWAQTANGSGTIITVNDPFDKLGPFPYTITIELQDGTHVTSPMALVTGDPPIIINELGKK